MDAPILPTELWLHVIAYVGSQPVYYTGDACCGGRWHPAPGSSLGVGPLSITPDRDLVALSATCRFFRDVLADEVSFTNLYVCLRDGELVRHDGGPYPTPFHKPISYFPLDPAVLGPRVKRLALALYVEDGPGLDIPTEKDLHVVCDAAADRILSFVPNLAAIDIHIRLGCSGNGHSLSPKMTWALASLQQLVDIRFSGCNLPDLPGAVLSSVRRLETTHVVTSFDAFPNLRELRNDQYWLEQDAYRIPRSTFQNLEVVHYCPPDNIDCLSWFPNDCKALSAAAAKAGTQMRVRELVLRHTVNPDLAKVIITALASPHVRIFVCYGLFRALDRYDELLVLAKKSFPNAAIDFVDYRRQKAHEHGPE